jgi:ABC-type lipoprotein export system ATPase subunit
LTIDQGELAAIAGLPGSGKTTVLHLMATLDRPSPGIVRLNGHPCQMNRLGIPGQDVGSGWGVILT